MKKPILCRLGLHKFKQYDIRTVAFSKMSESGCLYDYYKKIPMKLVCQKCKKELVRIPIVEQDGN